MKHEKDLISDSQNIPLYVKILLLFLYYFLNFLPYALGAAFMTILIGHLSASGF